MTGLLHKKIDKAGVYNLTADQYFGSDPVEGGSLTSSGARLLIPPNCPALYHYRRTHPRHDTAAYDEGHAAHAAILGVGAPVRVCDYKDWKTKAAQAERDEARAAGEIPLLPARYEAIVGMERAIRNHDVAGPLFEPGTGVAEQTIVWRDPEFPVWRRSMIDWMPHAEPGERRIAVDLKTTLSAFPSAIAKTVGNYGYHLQGAWYTDGVAEVVADTDEEPAFVFVFIEKEPPHLITVGQLDPDAMEWGRIQNRKAVATYARCMETDTWPGYTNGVESIGLPSWMRYQFEAAYDRGDYSIGDEDE